MRILKASKWVPLPLIQVRMQAEHGSLFHLLFFLNDLQSLFCFPILLCNPYKMNTINYDRIFYIKQPAKIKLSFIFTEFYYHTIMGTQDHQDKETMTQYYRQKNPQIIKIPMSVLKEMPGYYIARNVVSTHTVVCLVTSSEMISTVLIKPQRAKVYVMGS